MSRNTFQMPQLVHAHTQSIAHFAIELRTLRVLVDQVIKLRAKSQDPENNLVRQSRIPRIERRRAFKKQIRSEAAGVHLAENIERDDASGSNHGGLQQLVSGIHRLTEKTRTE